MGWLKTTPIVSLLLAVAFAAAPFVVDPARNWGDRYDRAVEEARELLVRNPNLSVDTDGIRVLDPEWMDELRTHAAQTQAGAEVELPARMVARSQAQLDGLLAQAYEARRLAEPVWRLGVLDGDTPLPNYWAHAFVHANTAGLVLLLVVLLIVGAPLERSWGSLLFSFFVALSIPVSAQGYRLLDASSGLPWSGSSGLTAALVGAYFIRGLGGQFVVPSVVVLPVWLAIEAFVVRGFWLDDLSSVSWATLCGAIGLGAGQAALLRLFGVEAKLDAQAAKRSQSGPNPVIVRAARLRTDGDPQQAFELMQAAWRENRSDAEIAEAFHAIALDLGRPEAAAEAILPVLRSALKQGEIQRALRFWLPLAQKRCPVRLEPTAAVRLGEALLDAGHPDEALFSLRSALDAGASTAHALRILNVARDLDASLSRRAAGIALTDSGLDVATRTKLEGLAGAAEDAGEPPAVEHTRFPGERTHPPAPSSVAAPMIADQADAASAVSALASDELSEASLIHEIADPAAGADLSDAAPSDVLSHWNDPSALSEDAFDRSDSEITDPSDEPLLAADPEARSDLFGDDDLDLLDADLDTAELEPFDLDSTPLCDSSGDQTSPMEVAGRRAGDDPDREATVMMGRTRIGTASMPTTPATPPTPPGAALLRAIRVIDAVPLEVRADAIEIDTDTRGKSRLPIARIEAIGLAAVRGLGPRPVIVVDCCLNWRDDIGSPLKLIRFRSDRVEPAAVGMTDAGISPMAALAAFAVTLQRASGAVCRPSDVAFGGSPPSFDSLEHYEREVLGAERELGG